MSAGKRIQLGLLLLPALAASIILTGTFVKPVVLNIRSVSGTGCITDRKMQSHEGPARAHVVDYCFESSGKKYSGETFVSAEQYQKLVPGLKAPIRYSARMPWINRLDLPGQNETDTGLLGFVVIWNLVFALPYYSVYLRPFVQPLLPLLGKLFSRPEKKNS